jgi:DNA repair protein RecO (recombination protein O)
LAAMQHIGNADLKRVFSFSIEGDALENLCDLCEKYVLTQLDRSFGSLDYYKRVL